MDSVTVEVYFYRLCLPHAAQAEVYAVTGQTQSNKIQKSSERNRLLEQRGNETNVLTLKRSPGFRDTTVSNLQAVIAVMN